VLLALLGSNNILLCRFSLERAAESYDEKLSLFGVIPPPLG